MSLCNHFHFHVAQYEKQRAAQYTQAHKRHCSSIGELVTETPAYLRTSASKRHAK